MRKSVLIGVAVFLLAVSMCGNVLAEEGNYLTMARFADFLVNALGIQLPEDTKELPPTEYFEAVSNILATKGINSFVNVNPQDTVTYGDMASIMYTMVGGKDAALDANGKIEYLVNSGYLSSVTSYDTTVTLTDAASILTQPSFTTLVAEAYHEPAGGGTDPGAGAIGNVDAPGVTTENTASQT